MRIQYNEMVRTLTTILQLNSVEERSARDIATIITESSTDGVYSHGLNRFLSVIENIEAGIIDVHASPEIVSSFGALEVVEGNLGMGITNASYAMDRAITLAKTHGIACVSMRNTNHWLRGATYGLQASNAGVIGICFTNTCPNMPAWGAIDSRLGNNPMIIAIPNGKRGIVLDMAMSQYSYGKLSDLAAKEQQLSHYGGYNEDGNLSVEASDILSSGRVLPIGMWKGSGLSLMLDLLASILSGGDSTKRIGEKSSEYGVSQVFIAIDPSKNNAYESISKSIEETIAYIKNSTLINKESMVYYPGEQSEKRREENLSEGILVNEDIWQDIIKRL